MMRLRLTCLSCLLLITACGSLPSGSPPASDRSTAKETPTPVVKPGASATGGYTLKRGGGFYKDDGPGDNPPENLDGIPNAVPRTEPLHRFANNPYTVLGRDYTPTREIGRYRARGIASWYGKKFHGQKTSIGDRYDMYGMTAAHPTLPLPSYVRVTSLANGQSVVLRVNDRGPFHADRIIDLSYTAAWKLGLITGGSGMVEVESLTPGAPDTPPLLLASRSEDIAPGKTAGERPLPEIDDARGAWLQLGAFGNQDNAEALKTRLAGELGELGEKLVVRVGGNLFRVQIGPWADAQEARGIAEKLAELLKVKPILLR